MSSLTPRSAITHYQTSFRIEDPEQTMRRILMDDVFDWVCSKESDQKIHAAREKFAFEYELRGLDATRSVVKTFTAKSPEGNAWALHYEERDKSLGPRRFWYSDIGLKQEPVEVIASVRISYAWNKEDLRVDREMIPVTTVPQVVRKIMQDKRVFSGRKEFRLLQKPLVFNGEGFGKAVATFIQSPDRKYPVVVFNGNAEDQVEEANRLAYALTGKCQVCIIAESNELALELKEFLPEEYWVKRGWMRVFFPFGLRKASPARHRWYDIRAPEYQDQRIGMIAGLLRNHSLLEAGSVESIADVQGLENRGKLKKLEAAAPEFKKQLDDFLTEHAKVAAERDDYKREAAQYAVEVDQREQELKEERAKSQSLQASLRNMQASGPEKSVADVFKSLPQSLEEVARISAEAFPRLIVTESAIKAAREHKNCTCYKEAWEILRAMSEVLYKLKFENAEQDLEGKFRDVAGYDLAMSEGKMTKANPKLMRLRQLQHNNKTYDISPHVKHGNQEPKLVRVHFAFDEEERRIVVGHIGRHIPNYTTGKL